MTQSKCLYYFDNKELFYYSSTNTTSTTLNDPKLVLVLACRKMR